MLKVRSSLIACGVACFALACSARAGSISAILGPVGPGPGTGLDPGTVGMTVVFDGTSEGGAYVGQINFHDVSGDLSSTPNSALSEIIGPGGTFSTYCIEGLQNVFFSSLETWNGVSPANEAVVALADAPNPATHFTSSGTPNQVEEITEFWDRFHDGVVTGANGAGGDANLAATAFQLGIWEIVNDGNIVGDFSNPNLFTIGGPGNFQASGNAAATGLAKTWLADLTGTLPTTGTTYTVYALTDGGIQDQIFGVQNSSGNIRPVPLPAALPAGLSLLGGLAVLNFRRRRAN